MTNDKNKDKWEVKSQFVNIESPWLTVIGENLVDDDGKELDYWRVEKPNGMIIITTLKGSLVLPKQMYRPGVGKHTLDFCGGRVPDQSNLLGSTKKIVERELKLEGADPIDQIKFINEKGWAVDSSFTNVYLYSAEAKLKADTKIDPDAIGGKYEISSQGFDKLLDDLECLQCREVFFEWLHQRDK